MELNWTALFLSFLVCVTGDDAIITATIDCSSGMPDVDSAMTSSSCKAQCMDVCQGVKNDKDLENCLSNEAIKGCLFRVGHASKKSVSYCVNVTQSLPVLVVAVSGQDIYEVGEPSIITGVSLVAQLKDTTLLRSCANKNVAVGISTVHFKDKVCEYQGKPSWTKSFSISGDRIMIPITEAFDGAWGSKADNYVFMELQDSTCGTPVVKDAAAYFSMSYTSGFIDMAACSHVTDCVACKATGCHWCDWKSVADIALPSWLPDYDWVSSVRQKTKGQCGWNSALCKFSTGNFDTCAAAPALTLASLISLLLISILV